MPTKRRDVANDPRMPANVWAAEYHSKIRKKIASANDNGCSRTAADHQCGGPGRTRTCNQTVMSGGITMGFVDVAVFLSQSDRVRCLSVGSFLVRNRCGHACSCRRVGIDMYRSLSPFRMIMERIDLALSRLKQGFDSPRERQQTQALRWPSAAFVE